MKILIVGGSGMLGKQVVQAAQQQGHEVSDPTWSEFPLGRELVELGNGWIGEGQFPEVVINCAGLIPSKSKKGDNISMLMTNAVRIQELAEDCQRRNVRLIHMSTDCVFSGRRNTKKPYCSFDLPDPIDIYGRSKLAGEPFTKNSLTVRGSFIGLEHGFFHWLLGARGKVQAWIHAYWNGTSAWHMAKALVDLAASDVVGIKHVAAAEPVSKAWMVEYLVEELNLPIDTVELVPEPIIWRVLEPDIEVPPIKTVLDELVVGANHILRL